MRVCAYLYMAYAGKYKDVIEELFPTHDEDITEDLWRYVSCCTPDLFSAYTFYGFYLGLI